MPRPRRFSSNQEYIKAFNAAAYDSITLRVPKGRKEDIEAHIGPNESLNGFINGLLRDALGMTEDQWKATK